MRKLLHYITLYDMFITNCEGLFGAMHFIYQINRLTTTKVDSTYLG